MSDLNDNYETWQEPGTGSPPTPLEPGDKVWIFCKVTLILLAETGNWLLHTSNYALVNTVGSDLFVIDILGLPDIPMLSNLSVGTLINGVLGLAAVATPAFLFSQLIERHEEIFGDTNKFFSNGLHMVVTGMFALLYFFVISTEFATLYMRVVAESAPSPIPGLSGSENSFWPMLIMSVALIITNAAMGLAAAHILHSAKRALKGE
ncbi:MAG: hypothetical protein L3J75_07495 [Methylococcaceae bacterium]|nr:hypothetical protein [Methylococcaceae bacterium]